MSCSQWFWQAVALLVCLGLASCGPGTPPTYPVEGVVKFRGKPLPGAIVTFVPFAPAQSTAAISTATEEDGTYRLTSTQAKGGLPEGKYRVAVTWRELRRDGDEWIRSGRNLLPPRYANPETSNLVVTVTPGQNSFPLELVAP